MVDEDLGQATIVYETPDGETDERVVDNEHVAYVQDHWIVKTDETEAERDQIRRIPASRVYYVERDVEAFEEEVSTMLREVQSVADGVGQELRRLPERFEEVAGGLPTEILGGRGERGGENVEEEPIEIEVGTEGGAGVDAGDVDEGEVDEGDVDEGEADEEGTAANSQ